jgi:MoaA/NifB/PqqE/SkfB family radical SAM enzyme
MEWNNPYNSFNSAKGLTYYENYQKILGWMDGKNALPPPIEVSLDPVNGCNNKCYYCNSQRYLRDNPTLLKRWGRDYMEDLLIDLSAMGVKAFCWGGGGESTLNIRLPEMIDFGVKLGMECSIITNGVNLSDELIDKLMLCRWVGISLDSADPEVYKKVRGTNDCARVLNNIKKLVFRRTKTDISVKVLALPETVDTILYTCQVARELGVQDFHVRPVDLERKDFKDKKQPELDVEKIQSIFDECKCLASPILMQICTDKKMYACVDHRLEPRFEIKEWGSEQHRELLKSINPLKECSRCTFREYHKQVEAVKNDTMCRSFP